MDSITHTLFGAGIYKAISKEGMTKKEKYAYLFTALGASQAPDSDIISQLWDTEGLYQMWHRGITHSLVLVPVWALVFYLAARFIFKVNSPKIYFLGLLGVFIHDTSDVFNAWGTGYLEPFTDIRLTFGTISIVDFVIWAIFLICFIISRTSAGLKEQTIFKLGWLVIILHVTIQSAQGIYLYNQYKSGYDQVALSAEFVPWQFTIIAKSGNTVDIMKDSTLTEPSHLYKLTSNGTKSDLKVLFKNNPKAETLYRWAPFVVIEKSGRKVGVYDPRFYRNGESFLYEYIELH
ncbi:metal-dependent hydrolase [Peribacillus sp. SCS-37]|uniref:metal-dependent hydrolase n=1 Tax=Paraperibacillus esterisolvens TaxID=3115296 RepID=UPI0039064A0C